MDQYARLKQLVDSMIETSTTIPTTAIIHWDPKKKLLKLIGPDATKRFFDGQYVRNMLSRSANEVGILVYGGSVKVRSKVVEKPQKLDITSQALRSQALRTHVADFIRKFMRLKHGLKIGYWGLKNFRPPFWPRRVRFISPNDRTKGHHLSVADLKVITTHFYKWLDDGNWEKLSEQRVKRTAPQGDSDTCSGESEDELDGHTASGVKRVKTATPNAMDDESQDGVEIGVVTRAAEQQTLHTEQTDQQRPTDGSTMQFGQSVNQQQYSALSSYHVPAVLYQGTTQMLGSRITDGMMAQSATSLTGISPPFAQNSFAGSSSVTSSTINVNCSLDDNSTYIDVVGMDTYVNNEVPCGTRTNAGGKPMTAASMTQRKDQPPHVAQTDQRPPGDDSVMHTMQPLDPQWLAGPTQDYHDERNNTTNQLSVYGSTIFPPNVHADSSVGNYMPSVIDRNGPLPMSISSPDVLDNMSALDCTTPCPAPNVTSPENNNISRIIEDSPDDSPIDSSGTNDGASKQPSESLASAVSNAPHNSYFAEHDQSDDSSDSCDSRDNSNLAEQNQSDDSSDSWDDTSEDYWELSDSEHSHSDETDRDTHAGDEPNIVSKRAKERLVTPRITCKESQRNELVATRCDGMDGMDIPLGVCVLGDHVVVGDSRNHRVHLLKRTGPHSFSEVSSLGGEGSDCFDEPYGMCTGEDGRVYMSDFWNGSLKEIDIAEDGQLRVLRALTAEGRLKGPSDVCTAYNSGQLLVVCGNGVHVVDVTTGDIISTLPTPTRWTGRPWSVAYRDGRIVVTHDDSPHLLVYTAPYTHGAVHTIQGLGCPWGVVIDKHRNILVTDWANKCIFRLDIDSNSVSRYDYGEYGRPRYMALDGEHLLITTCNGVIRADMTQFSAP